jgi:hypothetical protein
MMKLLSADGHSKYAILEIMSQWKCMRFLQNTTVVPIRGVMNDNPYLSERL